MSAANKDLHDEDEALGKALDMRILRRLVTYVVPFWRSFALSIVLLFLMSWTALVGPYLIKRAVDGPLTVMASGEASSTKAPLQDLFQISVLFLVVLVVESGLRYGQVQVTNICGQNVIQSLRKQVFAHIHRMSLAFFDRNPVGKLVTRVTSDVESLSEVFISGAAVIFEDVFKLVLIVVVLFWINPPLAAVTLATLLPLFFVANAFRVRSRNAYREVRNKISSTNAYLQEAVSGLRLIQIFGQEERSLRKFDERNTDLRDSHLRTVRVYATFFPAVEIVSWLGVVVLLLFGARQIVGGSLTFGQFIQFWFYTKFFFEPIRDLAEKYNVLQSAMASSERIFRILDTSPDIAESERPEHPDDMRGAIEFDGVTFSYRKGEPILHDVSFKVAPGETVALVGATGAGKSSIIGLIPRFYDVDSGTVRVDGIDVRQLPKGWLRSRIGVVLQDVFLFSGTIADNIRLGEREAIPLEKVREVASCVHASRFIEKLPRGYDTEVHERGVSLSVGERQLLSFARALAFDPKVLILDEATSSIDTETELLIEKALDELLKERTSLIIAHRLSTIKRADRILVIHHGRIREEGTHDELLRKGGIYGKLYRLQYEAQERLAAR